MSVAARRATSIALGVLAAAGAAVVLWPMVFIAAIVLAGPHSDLLPRVLQIPVGVLAWVIAVVVPIWAGCRVRRVVRVRLEKSGEHAAASAPEARLDRRVT